MRVRRLFLWELVVILLAGCGAAPAATALPTIVVPTPSNSRSTSGAIFASGEVVPVHQIQLGFAAAGVISEVNVKEGDVVKAGQTLAGLENIAQLQTLVTAAEQALLSAQKDLEILNTNAPLALANAQLAVVKAQKQYDDAQKNIKVKNYHRCDQDIIDLYGQILEKAKDAVKRLEDNPDNTSITYLRQLTAAKSELDTAQSNFLYCIQFTDQEIAESQANIAVADAALKQASAHYDLLKQGNGLDPDEAVRLNARVASAESALASAKYALKSAQIQSPIDGTIITLDAQPGQAVLPGQTIALIGSLGNLQMETTDLSERDVLRVKVGQPATVSIDALGSDITGKVARIIPKATKVGGDVVFKVIIQLDEQPEGLLWGMSGKVEIAAQ
jgi:multidrug efflux pump subunit AcrA (membrane-fusion protein)